MERSNSFILLLTFGLIVGILLSAHLEIALDTGYTIVTLGGILLITTHLLALKKEHLYLPFTVSVFLITASIGIIRYAQTDPQEQSKHYTHLVSHTQDQRVLLEIKQRLKPSAYQNKYIAEVITIDTTATSGLLLLNIQKDTLENHLQVGQRFFTKTGIQPVPTPRHPFAFDYGSYLKSLHVYGQLNANTGELFLSRSRASGLLVAIARLRESIQKNLRLVSFNKDQYGVINALLLGQRDHLPTALREEYAAAGTIHILAVSGLHVGVLLLIFRLLWSPLNTPNTRWLHSFLVIACIWMYACLTGLSPSVLRAASMFTFLEIGRASRRESYGFDALAVSALVLLLFDPKLLFQVGFQLSYLAVIAILLLQPYIAGLWKTRWWITRKIRDILSVTIAAQIGVLPLSIYYFHQFPSLFLVSNIVILPVLGILLSCGLLMILSTWIQPENFLTLWYGKAISVLNSFIQWVAEKEAFLIDGLRLSIPEVLGWYVFIFGLFWFLKKKSYQTAILAYACGILLLAISLWTKIQVDSDHFIIHHERKKLLAVHYEHATMRTFVDDTASIAFAARKLKDTRQSLSIHKEVMQCAGYYFRFKRKNILRLDSLGIYEIEGLQPDVIWLSHSPKLHLERLLTMYPEASIVADGTNYASDVNLWRATCLKQKHPFHSTYEKGAFMLKE